MSHNFLELEVAWTCNLACKYCYQRPLFRPITDKSAYLSPQKAVQKVLKFLDQYKRDFGSLKDAVIGIEFFGGEPTLNKDAIVTVYKEIGDGSQFGCHISYSMFSNGTIFLEEVAEAMRKGMQSVMFSIGDPFHQNLFRPFANGRDSYSVVHDTLMEYLQATNGLGMSLRSELPFVEGTPLMYYHRLYWYEKGLKSFSCTFVYMSDYYSLTKEIRLPASLIQRIIACVLYEHKWPRELLCPFNCLLCPNVLQCFGGASTRYSCYGLDENDEIEAVSMAALGDFVKKRLSRIKGIEAKRQRMIKLEELMRVPKRWNEEQTNLFFDILYRAIESGPVLELDSYLSALSKMNNKRDMIETVKLVRKEFDKLYNKYVDIVRDTFIDDYLLRYFT